MGASFRSLGIVDLPSWDSQTPQISSLVRYIQPNPLSSTETVIKDLPGQTAAREWLIGQRGSHPRRWAPVWDPTWTNNVRGAGMGGAAGPEGARSRHIAVLLPHSTVSAWNRSSWTSDCRWTCTQHTAALLDAPPARAYLSQTHTLCVCVCGCGWVSARLSVTSLSD